MDTRILPIHIAIIMDGNGRWAKRRFLPRIAGHKAGVEAVRNTVKHCVEKNIEVLSLFAFSSENWRRPEQEVNFLMDLFILVLEREVKKLHKQNIQLRIVGDRSRFHEKLVQLMRKAEALTQNNTGMKLLVAANYGGRWDVTEACRRVAEEVEQGKLSSADISPGIIEARLATAGIPEPDLFIRTSGEQRISNFMIWQLAYSELYFSEVLWPDFNTDELDKALAFYASRERRYGYISEQLRAAEHA
jgi:undecaprenyl diphosphate synthase